MNLNGKLYRRLESEDSLPEASSKASSETLSSSTGQDCASLRLKFPTKGLSGRKAASGGLAGFTLMEVLFAAMAFALIVLVMKTTFYGALKMRDRGEERMDHLLVRRQAVQLLRNDLLNLTFTSNLFAQAITCEAMGTPQYPRDQFTFYTSSGIIADGQYAADLQKVQYQLAEPVIRTNTIERGLDLVRVLERNPLVTTEQPVFYQRLLAGVESLDFNFFDGETWQDDWDTEIQDPPTPAAVRMAVRFFREDPKAALKESDILELIVPISVQPGPAAEESEESDDEQEEGENNGDNNNNGGGNGGGNNNPGGNQGGGGR